MSKIAIWHSDKSRKPGTVRVICDSLVNISPAVPIAYCVEQRIKDSALGEETWMSLSKEHLPEWVIKLISEFVEKITRTA